jgi:hypothetical protein
VVIALAATALVAYSPAQATEPETLFVGGTAQEFADHVSELTGKSVLLLDDGNIRDLNDNRIEEVGFSYIPGTVFRSDENVAIPIRETRDTLNETVLQAGYEKKTIGEMVVLRPRALPEELLSEVLGRRMAPVYRAQTRSALPSVEGDFVIISDPDPFDGEAFSLGALANLDWDKTLELHPRMERLQVVATEGSVPVEEFAEALAYVAYGKLNDQGVKMQIGFDGVAYANAAYHGLFQDAYRIAQALPYSVRQVPIDLAVNTDLHWRRDVPAEYVVDYFLPSRVRSMRTLKDLHTTRLIDAPLLNARMIDYWVALAVGHKRANTQQLEQVLNHGAGPLSVSLTLFQTERVGMGTRRTDGDTFLSGFATSLCDMIDLKKPRDAREKRVLQIVPELPINGDTDLSDEALISILPRGRTVLVVEVIQQNGPNSGKRLPLIVENPLHTMIGLTAFPVPPGAFKSFDDAPMFRPLN